MRDALEEDAAGAVMSSTTEKIPILQADPATERASRADLTHDQQVQRLRAEVDALREQLQRAQRLAAVGTLAAMVAHEFNNILTPVINYAQLAQKNPDFFAKAVDRAADGGARATAICDAILGLTRDQPQLLTEVNLHQMVEGIFTAMGRDLKKDAIELALDIPADLTITTAPVELQQVLLNLILNARQALLDKSGARRMEIRCRRDEGQVVLEVRDNAAGIAPENLRRIFEPFFTTRDDPGAGPCGSGLGLAICRQIVERLGGEIHAASQVGAGATFRVRIPARR